MKTSQRGLEFIKDHEGCELDAYPDPATGGVPFTIGVGHTKGVRPGDRCTLEDAMIWLSQDVSEAEDCIEAYVDVPLTQAQYDALVSFIFNLGCGAFKGSTLLKRLNLSDYAGAAAQFLRWDKAAGKVMAGLTKRRADESELFLT